MASKGTLTSSCKVDSCDGALVGRGWCGKHYKRARKYGDPHRVQPLDAPRPQCEPGEGVQCQFCSGWYTGRKHLLKHINRVHNDVLPVPCPGCSRRFIDDRGKQTHVGHAHPELIAHRANDPRVRREWNLRTNYGISSDDYDRMLRVQGGQCAACPATESDEPRGRLSVDHCHETGTVRGLLCGKCNRAIGNADDDPARLRRLADYLEGGR